METKIASYQEPGVRLQLVKIYELVQQIKHDHNFKPIKTDKYCECNIHYQIRKNRKVICTYLEEWRAKQRFDQIIRQELFQTEINYEK